MSDVPQRPLEPSREALPSELDQLSQLNMTLAADRDLDTLTQFVIDTATRLTGAAYGSFFERVLTAPGEPEVWRLASLTGAPLTAFTRFGLPRPTALFRPTFAAEAVIRSADVLADPRYGSMGGMPKGHLPVRSYMAVAVVSRTAGTTGALLFGHPEPGRFGEREERFIVGFAAQAGVAIDNARLFTLAGGGEPRAARRRGGPARLRCPLPCRHRGRPGRAVDQHGGGPDGGRAAGLGRAHGPDPGRIPGVRLGPGRPSRRRRADGGGLERRRGGPQDLRLRASRASPRRPVPDLRDPRRADLRRRERRGPRMGRRAHRHHRAARRRGPPRRGPRGRRGRQPRQEPVHRQHEPRAAHAALGRDRLQRHGGGGDRGARPRRPRRGREEDRGQRPASPRPHQRRARPQQDRGGPHDRRGGRVRRRRHDRRRGGGRDAAGGQEAATASSSTCRPTSAR